VAGLAKTAHRGSDGPTYWRSVYALVITGAPGSGKSRTLEALSDQLYDDDIAHACLDVDALSWAHPALPTETHTRHIAALADLYCGEGYDLLLVAAAIPSAPEREALIDALGSGDHFVVRLDAPEEVLHHRISEREPAGWSQLGRLLDRASQMHRIMEATDADLVLDTERTEPQSAASEIRRACPRLRDRTSGRGD
jgi:adenylylsulfate kinase-like enzyme